MNEFYYRVGDDSMTGDRLYPGDYVLVQEADTYQIRDICAIARVSDISQLDFRRVERKGGVYKLVPSNPAFSEEDREAVFIVGRVAHTYINM
ncbi:LexA family protein [Paenibacillus donghaensis]|uniref:Peptidase S24/S26A/S26B/S26C domain-containing protein n=1 Tax=Paenibacillus donghaensis TaxID=414771 RepID=A0A2Z2KFZ6_9BACL|nr:S24 family peptidase [Paenibacillus donghaensis]ASA22050.1 hypothetical protein B9T62_15460 [Paenibacillus donghaensis]